MSVFRSEYTVYSDRFIIYSFVTVVCINECQDTIEIKMSSKDRRKYLKSLQNSIKKFCYLR
jgi:hypothetical protein